jgi:hypothetical protein
LRPEKLEVVGDEEDLEEAREGADLDRHARARVLLHRHAELPV